MSRLTKEMFENIVAFSFSEPGAMGPNDMSFYTRNGESFTVEYLSHETPYELLKELFPILQQCYWNGPMRGDRLSSNMIIIDSLAENRGTCIPEGFKHLYLDFGNHLVIKEEYYDEVKGILAGKSNCEITFNWTDFLEEAKFSKKMDEIEKNSGGK